MIIESPPLLLAKPHIIRYQNSECSLVKSRLLIEHIRYINYTIVHSYTVPKNFPYNAQFPYNSHKNHGWNPDIHCRWLPRPWVPFWMAPCLRRSRPYPLECPWEPGRVVGCGRWVFPPVKWLGKLWRRFLKKVWTCGGNQDFRTTFWFLFFPDLGFGAMISMLLDTQLTINEGVGI